MHIQGVPSSKIIYLESAQSKGFGDYWPSLASKNIF